MIIEPEKPDTDSDEDYMHIDIKSSLKDYIAKHPGQRIPIDLINEAVRWRLNQNDC